MAALLSFGPFDEKEEKWTSYVERLEQVFLLNDVKEEKKRAMLITAIGPKLYNVLGSLCQPMRPIAKSYVELVTLITEHLCPKPSIYTERSRFHCAVQLENESIAQFVARLRLLSTHCEFGQNLSEILRDRIVCGIKSEKTKQRLLTENVLTLDSVIKLATAWELSYNEAMGLTREKGNGNINKLAWNRYDRNKKSSFKQEPEKVQGKQQAFAEGKICYCCGKKGHLKPECRYKTYKCNQCKKEGHLATMCKTKADYRGHYQDRKKQGVQRCMTGATEDTDEEEGQLFSLETCISEGESSENDSLFEVTLEINNKLINMEIDTGSSHTVISKIQFEKEFKECKMVVPDIYLKYYTGEKLHPIGQSWVNVKFNKIEVSLPIYIVEGGGPPLVGKDWIKELGIIKREGTVKKMESTQTLEKLIENYKDIFDGSLGTYTKGKCKLRLKEGAKPKFYRARPIPFSLKGKVDEELDRLLRMKILEPVEFSEWATPVVPVPKENGSVHLCGDYKITINPELETDKYPISNINELVAGLTGGKSFSKVDLSQAYQQVELDNDSRDLVTINTHRGLFRYTLVTYGVASAPGMFQGIPGVVIFLDDILITGQIKQEHMERIEEVFKRLKGAGLKVQKSKCEYFKETIEYLGYEMNSKGLHTTREKVDAILRAPEPKDVSQLQALLGLINFYAKFVPKISEILSPWYRLLKKGEKYNFDEKCKKAYDQIKELITEAPILAHYDPECPLKLTCDASAYGLGALLSQKCKDGKERPIAFGSRTLNKAEKGYSSIDREALAIYWGVKKYYQYLYGRHFELVMDHKPLVVIFGEKRGIPQMGACRLQRYAFFLAGFSFKVTYTKSEDNMADALSRVPLGEIQEKTEKFPT